MLKSVGWEVSLGHYPVAGTFLRVDKWIFPQQCWCPWGRGRTWQGARKQGLDWTGQPRWQVAAFLAQPHTPPPLQMQFESPSSQDVAAYSPAFSFLRYLKAGLVPRVD